MAPALRSRHAALAEPARRLAHLAMLGLLLVVYGCGKDGDESSDQSTTSVVATASAAGAKPGRFVLPPHRSFDSNPLGLPDRRVTVAEGSTLFTVPKRALVGAGLRSSLALRSAKAVGLEGGMVLVQMGREPPYLVHPGYVIVPRTGRLRRGSYVLAKYRGRLRHGVVGAIKRERASVRFTDGSTNKNEVKLRLADLSPQPAGLVPGNYAVYRDAEGYHHVMLLSSGKHGGGKTKWLVLGYAAEARLVPESQLRALPLGDAPKSGAAVWVAWRGRMVPARVRSVEPLGLMAVRRERFAAPVWVGADRIMPPP